VGLLALTLAVVAALSVLVSGCGGSSGEGVAEVDTTEPTTTTGSDSRNGGSDPNPAAYSACMRNGVPKFPDPDGEGRIRVRGGTVDPESAQFKAAANTCRSLAPPAFLSPGQQAEFREQLLGFSACMRENGVPTFPDPQFEPDGSGGISIDGNSGIDEDSPQFRNAEETCEKLFPDPSSRDGQGRTR
jgi:hypothetical protein